MCTGSVYYYTLTGSYWSHQSKIFAQDASDFDWFGTSVSIYGDNTFIGGAQTDDDKGFDTGTYIL
jgi:hypothetical protein